MQELRAKVRIADLRRSDDVRRIRELEARLSEAETFVALRPKLQAKLTQQQTDLIATRRELADAQQLAQRQEERLLDTQEQLELVSVDKEVAEERAESAEAELEEIKERLANMEVELQVLREGGGVYLYLRFSMSNVVSDLFRLKELRVEARLRSSIRLPIFNWRSRMNDSRRLSFGLLP